MITSRNIPGQVSGNASDRRRTSVLKPMRNKQSLIEISSTVPDVLVGTSNVYPGKQQHGGRKSPLKPIPEQEQELLLDPPNVRSM